MVVYPAFMNSLQHFHRLMQKAAVYDTTFNFLLGIDRQFKRYVSEVTDKISVNANLDNSTLDQAFLVRRDIIFPEVINTLPKLKRLEQAFEAKKLASETTLAEFGRRGEISLDDYSPEIRKWIEEGQIQIGTPIDPESVKELIQIYDMQIRNIARYKDEILKTLIQHYGPRVLANGAMNIIRKSFDEDHRLRKALEERLRSANAASKPGKPKGKPSYTTYAMALHVKNITITKEAIGVANGINYAELFELQSPVTLYNRYNDVVHGRKGSEECQQRAREIIKMYKL